VLELAKDVSVENPGQELQILMLLQPSASIWTSSMMGSFHIEEDVHDD
jgi:hypothetical protein